MKSAIILSLGLISGLSAAAPQGVPADKSVSTSSIPSGTVNFSEYKVPKCDIDDASGIRSNGQVPNGHCMAWDWLRSIAYYADFPHTYCDVKFFSDDKCSPDKEVPQPGKYSTNMIQNYFPGCFDDLAALGGGVTVEEGWVVMPLVNMTVTCT